MIKKNFDYKLSKGIFLSTWEKRMEEIRFLESLRVLQKGDAAQ